MAFTDIFEPFCVMDKRTVPDGYGGVVTEWVEGAGFMAGVSKNTSTEMLIAEKQGLKTIYAVATEKIVQLWRNDVIKRISDGLVFQVTSDWYDMTAPAIASHAVAFSQVTAERYDL